MKLKFPKKIITKSDWISFFLTLVATLIGVLIANSLSESSETKREKEFAIKLITSSSKLVHKTFKLSSSVGKSIEFLKQDSSYTEENITSIQINNPLPYPDFLKTALDNPAVLNNISSFTYEEFYKQTLNLKKVATFNTLSYYLEGLENIESLLTMEVKFLKKEFDINELKTAYEEAVKQTHQKYKSNEFDEIP